MQTPLAVTPIPAVAADFYPRRCTTTSPCLVVLTVVYRLCTDYSYKPTTLTESTGCPIHGIRADKSQPWRARHLSGKVAPVALVPGSLAVTKKRLSRP